MSVDVVTIDIILYYFTNCCSNTFSSVLINTGPQYAVLHLIGSRFWQHHTVETYDICSFTLLS